MNDKALNLDDEGELLTFKSAVNGPDRDLWLQAWCEEFDRLVEETGTIKFIEEEDKPRNRTATYFNPKVKRKPYQGGIKMRVRGTVGGDRVDYQGDRSSNTSCIEVLKVLLNAVVSEDAHWCTADIKDFYLGTSLPRVEYMRIQANQIPDKIREKYKLDLSKGYVMTSIHKGMYGLPHAGKLAQDQLNSHLKVHGFHMVPNTQCVYRHETKNIMFMLMTDDFGIKYCNGACENWRMCRIFQP